MKRKLLFFIFTLFVNAFIFSQEKNHWTVTKSNNFELTPYAEKGIIPQNAIQRDLNLNSLVLELKNHLHNPTSLIIDIIKSWGFIWIFSFLGFFSFSNKEIKKV